MQQGTVADFSSQAIATMQQGTVADYPWRCRLLE